jgi:iron complex outermembrane receptor protein
LQRPYGITALRLFSAQAQDNVITGKVIDSKDGSPIVGASVVPKGSTKGASTGADGSFRLNLPAGIKSLVITSVGFDKQEVTVDGATVSVSLVQSNANLNEVIVVGYGTARKRDVTGSVASVKAKDFNQGIMVAPDQLLQGKVAGLMVLNNSGQPGGQTTVRIRGNASVRSGAQPLYVVDGVPLDGRSARPALSARGIGTTAGSNPLNFINPNDIASMDVLKDASATAIYGSRGANGVIMVTLKKGTPGVGKVEASASFGISDQLKSLKVLSGDEYRDALSKYSIAPTNNDWGGNVDAMKEITRQAPVQNYNVAVSGGNENFRIRASFGYQNIQGIVAKSGLKKFTTNIIGSGKFLESKRLGFDFNVIGSQLVEDAAPISTDAGFEGSLIGMALQWNPTRPLRNSDGSLNIKGPNFPSTAYNPLAMSEAYDDESKTTGILASVSPYFKITKDLEYRMVMSINYSTGSRRQQMANYMNLQSLEGIGYATFANNELITQQFTHTLNYNKQISQALNLSATAGYEYQKFDSKGVGLLGLRFPINTIPYTNYFQAAETGTREFGSFADPLSELQSVFARVNLNWNDKFLFTGTLRADGSNKFGKNNQYGYFPSLAAAWNISNEDFLKESSFINNLKLRVGWGITGNQDFPAGAAQERYAYTGPGAIRQVSVANPDLKWENSVQQNIGVDFSMFKNRFYGTVEYFHKKTEDLLFNFAAIAPAPNTNVWVNLPGTVTNSGVEITLSGVLVDQKDLQVTLSTNVSFLHNELNDYSGATVLTGAISGQGLTGASSQQFINGKPLNAFYIGRYLGLEKGTGKALYDGDPSVNKFYFGSPNPTTLLGISLTVDYKKISFNANLNGSFGQYIYNNTTQAALAIGNIKGNRNIAQSVYTPGALEDPANAQPVSNRYLEKGDYVKGANFTVTYRLGTVGKTFKNISLFATAQNLFVITSYTGFDPEVNTQKPIGDVPSLGIEYTPYPSARTYNFGINFSL